MKHYISVFHNHLEVAQQDDQHISHCMLIQTISMSECMLKQTIGKCVTNQKLNEEAILFFPTIFLENNKNVSLASLQNNHI